MEITCPLCFTTTLINTDIILYDSLEFFCNNCIISPINQQILSYHFNNSFRFTVKGCKNDKPVIEHYTIKLGERYRLFVDMKSGIEFNINGKKVRQVSDIDGSLYPPCQALELLHKLISLKTFY